MKNSDEKPNHFLPLIFENKEFLQSKEARILRILGEYLYPDSVFRRKGITDTIVFFGSARIYPPHPLERGNDLSKRPRQDNTKLSNYCNFYQDAMQLAKGITKWAKSYQKKTSRKLCIVTGGGPGIMEAASRGVKAGGDESIGLNIKLPYEPNTNPYISKDLSFIFSYFFMRKYWFLYFARALVVFPGGFGTLDELFEALTLQQTQSIKNYIPVFLFGKKFWNRLIDFSFLLESGMIVRENLDLIKIVDTIPEALSGLKECFAKKKR